MHSPTRIRRAFGAALVAALAAAALAPTAVAAERPAVEHLNSAKLLPGTLPFSEAVRLGNTLYLSGQVGIEPGTMRLVPGGIQAEARQALANIGAVLTANGRSLTDLVKCTVMLADMADWPALNEVWKSVLHAPFPARSALGANGLALGARVEIECLASAAP
jgi:2-iminobutanoate/2-iminopropanoate deaminase